MDSIGDTVNACGTPIAWGTYTPCRQGGGSCPGSSSCFGGDCDYIERVSSNRFDGGYPKFPTPPSQRATVGVMVNNVQPANMLSRASVGTSVVKNGSNGPNVTLPTVINAPSTVVADASTAATPLEPQNESMNPPIYGRCMGQPPQTCRRVAPMVNGWGDVSYMNMYGTYWSFNKGYDVTKSSWVGAGNKCTNYVSNNAAMSSNVAYTKL